MKLLGFNNGSHGVFRYIQDKNKFNNIETTVARYQKYGELRWDDNSSLL
jgi:hypothetical protein